jgi:hypothetical protein
LDDIVDLASSVAMAKGLHEELDRAIDGNGYDESEYAAAEAEADEIYRRIEDTRILSVLRRYRLDDGAELFEHDRADFEPELAAGLQVSTGRKRRTAPSNKQVQQTARRVRDVLDGCDTLSP